MQRIVLDVFMTATFLKLLLNHLHQKASCCTVVYSLSNHNQASFFIGGYFLISKALPDSRKLNLALRKLYYLR